MPDLGDGLLGCFRCAYVWRLRKYPVRICPRCRSPHWNTSRPAPSGPRRKPTGAGPEEVLSPHRRALLELAKEYGARDVRVFGSVARGEAGPRSDVDLLMVFPDPPGILARMEFEERLETLLGRRVDLATESNLHWLIRPKVLAESVPV